MTNLDCTTIVCLDAKHYDQWRLTWPTWRKYRPELLEWPLLVVVDGQQLPEPDFSFVQHPDLRVTQWNGQTRQAITGDMNDTDALRAMANIRWESQREKMLSAFVHVPARHIHTKYYLKIDTDVVAMRRDDNWVQDAWFENDPVYVAKGWKYTKPPWHMETMDRWYGNLPTGDGHPTAMTPPLNLPVSSSGNKICHSRMISWLMFARTDWTREIASYCNFPALPIPSQDNFIWYMAERMGERTLTTNMKRFGWSWQSNMKNIRAKVEEAMRC